MVEMPTESVPTLPITLTILGAGQRGNVYASYALKYPERLRIVAVAEPNKIRREKMAKQHNIPHENVVSDWRDLAQRPRLSDAIAICLLDDLHCEACVAFAKEKYHILLEKPMATSMEDCLMITEAVSQAGVLFAISHVLRYTLLNKAIKRILDEGKIGRVLNIQHLEPVGFYHFAHSFVRGNWRNEKETTFSLMSKSCHDIDLVAWFMGLPCKRVSSFGSLTHFNASGKPSAAGSVTHCLECPAADQCPYDAKKIYLDPVIERGLSTWPVSTITDIPDIENVRHALASGPYGRCAYECDNDVVDQQVVNMEFEGGATVSFSMIATTEALCQRKTRIFGTLGQLEADAETNELRWYDFLTKQRKVFFPYEEDPEANTSGHGGGDYALLKAFLDAIMRQEQTGMPTVEETFESHLYVFAAEHARRTGTVVDVQEYKQQHLK
ncbi:uncharacterized protein VTP21DRAFT_109 [Calcarisporiella thermophila]|uniref:uncharacterized protein n=1 Tax=Calcarisporiella thermophila TaxID=911321 RepID=UPI00374468F2